MSEEKLNENKNLFLPERKLEKNICVMKCYFCTARNDTHCLHLDYDYDLFCAR